MDLLINVEFNLKSRRDVVLLLHMIKNFKSKVLDDDQSYHADVFKAVIIAEALGCDEVYYICGIQRLLELFLFVDLNYRIFGVDSKCWFKEKNCRFGTNLNIFPCLYLMVSAHKLQIRKFLIIFKPSYCSYTL